MDVIYRDLLFSQRKSARKHSFPDGLFHERKHKAKNILEFHSQPIHVMFSTNSRIHGKTTSELQMVVLFHEICGYLDLRIYRSRISNFGGFRRRTSTKFNPYTSEKLKQNFDLRCVASVMRNRSNAMHIFNSKFKIFPDSSLIYLFVEKYNMSQEWVTLTFWNTLYI